MQALLRCIALAPSRPLVNIFAEIGHCPCILVIALLVHYLVYYHLAAEGNVWWWYWIG